jgi:aminomuconate-semialdehyde/2-hydroxymuconate-6-semialdehyde dehydrogenase
MANSIEAESYHKENVVSHILRQPLGIVGTISPWNLPLYLFTWKIAPALVSGNCVIAKPSEITPYTSYLFSKICIEANLPAGTLNILHGNGVTIGRKIVRHEKIKAISFTGGTKTGKEIAREASHSLKKINLEMGGKNPVIIFDDCNYDEMMNSLLKSSFLNQGQICLAGSRIYIQKKIYKKFKDDFISRVKKLKIGDPFDSSTDQGAIVSIEHLNKISKYVNHAIEEGGEILVGGDIPTINGGCASGWYFNPTVIENLPQSSILNQEEIFGPVVTLNQFDEENDAIQMANDTDYGLASIIWTENINRAHKLAEVVESGLVWINCWLERDLRTPFGGIKNSGFGKEGGKYALDFFTEPKNICTKYYD